MRHFLLFVFVAIGVTAWSHDPHPSFDFKANKGQWHENVRYKSEQGAATLFLEDGGFTWCLIHPEDLEEVHDILKLPEEEQALHLLRMHAVKVHFENGLTPNVVGQEKNDFYFNYFVGNNPEKWASHVESFRAVRYSGIWDGVGMRAYNSGERMKYDFLVAPGADVSQIELRYEGAESIAIVGGELHITTSVGVMIEQAPYAYQLNGSQINEVACHFELDGDRVRFTLPEGYDSSRQLVIDPIVIASTLSGATGSSNYGHCAAFDIAGNIYTGAINFGTGYPTTAGAFQMTTVGNSTTIAISKLNPDGTNLVWASLLGGGSPDYPHSLIVNDQQELYVLGSTTSNNFPVTANAYDQTNNGAADITVSAFSADGASLIGSTYLGGSANDGRNLVGGNYGDTYRGEIYLDVNDRPIVASFTSSTNFPTTNGAFQTANAGGQDAVLFCLNPNLSNLVYSTYLGGSNNDAGFGVRSRVDGSVYIVGATSGGGFPTTAGAYQTNFLGGGPAPGRDGFIARFNPTATTLEACTFWATDEEDKTFFIDLDNSEDVYVYGQSGGDIPVTEGVYSEPNGTLFISKFDPMLSNLLVGTRVAAGGWGFGGAPVAFLVDRCDNVYISTHQANSGLPTTPDAVFTNGGFYLAAYGADLETLEFSTYYTGNHVDGGTSRFDKSGIVYQGVCSGGGFNTNPNAWAPVQNTGWDIGVFKMDFQVSGVNASLTASAEALNGCAPHTVDFNNFSVGNIYEWDFGDGAPVSNEFEPSHTYTEPGLYTVQLISMDSLSCNLADTAYVDIAVSIPQDFFPSFTYQVDCETFTIVTENTTEAPWLVYEWNMGDGTVIEGENITHVYAEEGEYTVTLFAEDVGCIADEEVQQTVIIGAQVIAEVDPDGLESCGEATVTFTNLSNGVSYEWDFGDGSPAVSVENPTHTFTTPGQYEVTLTAVDLETCNQEDQTTVTVTVSEGIPVVAAFELLQTDCDLFTVVGTNQSTGEYLSFEWDLGDNSTASTVNIEHNYATTGQYTVTLVATDTICDVSDTFQVPINVLDEVTAIIGNPPLSDCAPYTVSFVNNSAGSLFYWDFGDGSPIQEGQNAEHTYETPGDYTVTLTVEGLGNCGGADETTIGVNVIEPPLIDALFAIEQLGACEAVTVNFIDESTGDDLTYAWEVEGIIYSQASFEHVFNGAGTYSVTLTISEPVCDGFDSFTDVVEVLDGIDLEMIPEQFMCYYEDEKLLGVAGPSNAEYLWSNGDEGPNATITQPGQYFVTATLNNCTELRAVEVVGVPEMYLYDTPRSCEGIQTALRIPYFTGTNYLWCNGEAGDLIYTSEPGEYCYQFSDEFGCLQEGTVVLELIDRDASVYIPNAFTPNNDGINDVFKAYGEDLADFELSVWNRWGEEVFKTDDPDDFWDGSHRGGEYYTQDEVYTWQVEYRSSCSSEKITKKGYVVMMR